MTDIVLDSINSGYNLGKINSNFEKVEDKINDEILHLLGGNNTMQQDLDMNSNRILNLAKPKSSAEPLLNSQLLELASSDIGNATNIIYEDPEGLIYQVDDFLDELENTKVRGLTDIVDISNLATTALVDNQQFHMTGWNPGSDLGGGHLYYDSSRPQTDHDGGTVFAIDATPPTDFNDPVQVQTYLDAGSGLVGNGCLVRRDTPFLTVEMFGGGVGIDDTGPFNAAKSAVPKAGYVICGGSSYTISSFDFDVDMKLLGRGRRGTKITVTSFSTDVDTGEKYGIRLIGTVADGLSANPKMIGFEVENTTAEPNVNGFLVRRKSIIEDVYQHGATQDGWHFNTDAANNASFFSRFTDVWGKFNGRHGCNLQRGANSNIFYNCQFDSNGTHGLIQQTNGIAINGNIVIGGQASFNGDRGYEFASGTNFQLIGCYAEFNGDDLVAPAWAASTSYTAGDLITSPSSGLTEGQTSVIYEAASNHTSAGNFDTDYLAGLWVPYGTEMRVSNTVTFSDIRLGLALSNKTDRIRNESTQITTKVALGGILIDQSNLEAPNIQRLRYRDGIDIGQSSGSVTSYIDVGAGGLAKTIYREADTEIFGVEYDGVTGNPNNLLKVTSGAAGVLNVDCLIIEQDGGVRMPNLPTSSAGLTTGSLWNDAGTIKIV